MKQNLANLGAEIPLFHTPIKYINLPILSNIAGKALLQILELPLPLPDRQQDSTFLCKTCLRTAKGLNTAMADSWAPSLPKHPQWDPLWQETNKEFLPTCWELWKAKEPSSNKVQLELEVWIDLWHVLIGTWTELGNQCRRKKYTAHLISPW